MPDLKAAPALPFTPYWQHSVTWCKEPGNYCPLWSPVLANNSIMLKSSGNRSFRTTDHLCHTAYLPDNLRIKTKSYMANVLKTFAYKGKV